MTEAQGTAVIEALEGLTELVQWTNGVVLGIAVVACVGVLFSVLSAFRRA